MGLEARCVVHVSGRATLAEVLLETEELIIRTTPRLRVPLEDIGGIEAKGGRLTLRHKKTALVLDLGKDAEKWAMKIRYPKGRLDKLGVKPGMRVCVLGVPDVEFEGELRERTDDVSKTKPKKDTDLVFVFMKQASDTERLAALRAALKPAGGIWVIWTKGQKAFREDDARNAAKSVGLVDVKVVSFSDTLSGLKLVIPVALRAKA